jgi:hypothetical protein
MDIFEQGRFFHQLWAVVAGQIETDGPFPTSVTFHVDGRECRLVTGAGETTLVDVLDDRDQLAAKLTATTRRDIVPSRTDGPFGDLPIDGPVPVMWAELLNDLTRPYELHQVLEGPVFSSVVLRGTDAVITVADRSRNEWSFILSFQSGDMIVNTGGWLTALIHRARTGSNN